MVRVYYLFRGSASHRTLVPLHLPIWVFASFFLCVCVCVCVVLQIYIVFTRGEPNKAVKKNLLFLQIMYRPLPSWSIFKELRIVQDHS